MLSVVIDRLKLARRPEGGMLRIILLEWSRKVLENGIERKNSRSLCPGLKAAVLNWTTVN